jgi:hypothetical protein
LKKQEQAAIDAVARHFSATWEKGKGSRSASIAIGRRRIAVEVTSLKQRTAGPADIAKFRLRFDKVVFSVIRRLRAALGETVPEGKTVIVTITAPIRLAAKTTATLEDMIQTCLTPRSARAEVRDTVHGNQIQIRVVKSGATQIPKVIGLVHNPHANPDMLVDMTQSLIQEVGAPASKLGSGGSAKERWLVVAIGGGLSHIQTYRQIYAVLAISTAFKNILMVSAEGQVETLTA